ncbi:hypothetical protein UA08_09499 [Talaromyces atroroseus]|uniref:Uncharacterized protein n=1 Tax=Talaromyces atroroseus TaxID=1441469 RepID=A0A1Q5Q5X6_TALAT|nr:hypothetical protein UA08_09499 [Talaromyces atroroseus]OKL55228.1 hypothetical protein UA08_09499 [Talaromyces atroroseus]
MDPENNLATISPTSLNPSQPLPPVEQCKEAWRLICLDDYPDLERQTRIGEDKKSWWRRVWRMLRSLLFQAKTETRTSMSKEKGSLHSSRSDTTIAPIDQSRPNQRVGHTILRTNVEFSDPPSTNPSLRTSVEPTSTVGPMDGRQSPSDSDPWFEEEIMRWAPVPPPTPTPDQPKGQARPESETIPQESLHYWLVKRLFQTPDRAELDPLCS